MIFDKYTGEKTSSSTNAIEKSGSPFTEDLNQILVCPCTKINSK
jgi:hypothetical protein